MAFLVGSDWSDWSDQSEGLFGGEIGLVGPV